MEDGLFQIQSHIPAYNVIIYFSIKESYTYTYTRYYSHIAKLTSLQAVGETAVSLITSFTLSTDPVSIADSNFSIAISLIKILTEIKLNLIT